MRTVYAMIAPASSTLPCRVLTARVHCRDTPWQRGLTARGRVTGTCVARRSLRARSITNGHRETKAHKTNGLNATAATLRPLADRVVAKAVAREEMTKSGIMLPDTAKEKPMRATVVAVGEGRRSRGRDADSARCAGRRPDPLRQIRRHRVHARRGGAPHPVGKGHPRRRRILKPARSHANADHHGKEFLMSKVLEFNTEARQSLKDGRRHPRQRRQDHARSQGPQRRPRQEMGRARP